MDVQGKNDLVKENVQLSSVTRVDTPHDELHSIGAKKEKEVLAASPGSGATPPPRLRAISWRIKDLKFTFSLVLAGFAIGKATESLASMLDSNIASYHRFAAPFEGLFRVDPIYWVMIIYLVLNICRYVFRSALEDRLQEQEQSPEHLPLWREWVEAACLSLLIVLLGLAALSFGTFTFETQRGSVGRGFRGAFDNRGVSEVGR
jgi:hypothetical protein